VNLQWSKGGFARERSVDCRRAEGFAREQVQAEGMVELALKGVTSPSMRERKQGKFI
jgi:hypothetical protein